MNLWHVLHRVPWVLRWPLKWLLLAGVVTLMLYPKFWMIPSVVRHLQDPESLIEPNHPRIAQLAADERIRAARVADDGDLLLTVQVVVDEHVPYAFDWETWGVAEYTPTLDELFARGQEDCDGKAVVAASLLRHLGVDAWLVCDLQHVWVDTPLGETMSPGQGEPTVAQTAPGETPKATWNLEMIANATRGTRFAMRVYPLWRLVVMVLALWFVTAHPHSSATRRALGGGLMLVGLALIRDAGPRPYTGFEFESLTYVGAGLMLAGWIALLWRRPARPDIPAGEPRHTPQ